MNRQFAANLPRPFLHSPQTHPAVCGNLGPNFLVQPAALVSNFEFDLAGGAEVRASRTVAVELPEWRWTLVKLPQVKYGNTE
jgi:hypothetical protein